MQYKDLIYKITTGGRSSPVENSEMKKTDEVNPAKANLQSINDVLIGIMLGDVKLNVGISNAIKNEIERTLTVLFNSPISNSLAFLPFDKNSLMSLLELFPDRNFHFICEEDKMKEMTEIKKTKVNFKNIYKSVDINKDFVNKIDYLVTINVEKIDPAIESYLKSKNILIFPMNFMGTKSFSQPEKKVVPDATGWLYNSATGIWSKNWGWDGSQELPSWKAPDDWNLNPTPDINTGA